MRKSIGWNRMVFVGLLSLQPLAWVFWASPVQAGYTEVGGAFSYTRSNYAADSYSFTRRWTGSIAYHLSDVSSIELAYENAFERTKIVGYQDTIFKDKVYSASWVQALIGKKFFFQPFVKAGAGQLNREASGSYAGGGSPPARVDSLTVILGGGVRIFLTEQIVLRVQVTSYLEAGRIKSYKDNVATSFGTSIYF